MTTVHCTEEELNALLDGRLAPPRAKEALLHMEGCDACAGAYAVLRGLDASLRTLPQEEVRAGFADDLLDLLNINSAHSRLFSFFGNIGYFIGLCIVLGTMLAAFIASGLVDVDRTQREGSAAAGAVMKVGDAIASSSGLLARLLAEYVPFAFGSRSAVIVAMMMGAVLLVAGFDRLLARKISHALRRAGGD